MHLKVVLAGDCHAPDSVLREKIKCVVVQHAEPGLYMWYAHIPFFLRSQQWTARDHDHLPRCRNILQLKRSRCNKTVLSARRDLKVAHHQRVSWPDAQSRSPNANIY